MDDLEQLGRKDVDAYAKCFVLVELLESLGNELRRPRSDSLRDGIHELRFKSKRINYRILYFFSGNNEATLSHIIAKEGKVPPKEIDIAVNRKRLTKENPDKHKIPRRQ